MNKTHQIINNAVWLTLLGPLIGLLVAIPVMHIILDYPFPLFPHFANKLSFILVIAYIWGSLPALITGIITACFSPFYQKLPFFALTGGLTSALFSAIFTVYLSDPDLEVIGLTTFCGMVSSVIMYPILHYLRDNSPASKNMNQTLK